MAEVKILIEGFTNADSKESGSDEKTRTTTCLITDNNFKIVSDPGVLESQQVMIDALNNENLSVHDITHVFITHSHIDHYRNIGMFPEAKTVEYWGVWDKEKVWDRPQNLTENIEIIETPGHNYDGLSMLVKTNEGIIAIVGDVYWKENYPEDDPYASDEAFLQKSRKEILEKADFIVPGHGKIYKVNK